MKCGESENMFLNARNSGNLQHQHKDFNPSYFARGRLSGGTGNCSDLPLAVTSSTVCPQALT